MLEHMDDEKNRKQMINLLTGPLLTTAERKRQDAEKPSDEPPVPLWWDDDEEASESSIEAARLLGQNVVLS